MKHNQTQRIKALLLLSLMTLSTFAPAASLFQAWDTQDNKDLQPKLAKEKGEMLAIPFFQKGRKIQATGATLVAAVLGVVIATILQAGVNGFVGNATTRSLPVSTATKIKDALIAAFSPSQLKQVGLWSLVKALKADPTRADAASFGQRVFEWMMDNKTFIGTVVCEAVVGTFLGVREYRRSSEWNTRDKQRTALVENTDLELDKATAILMDAIKRQEAFEKLNTKEHQERGFTGKFSERDALAKFFEGFTADEATRLGLDHAKAKKADIEAARTQLKGVRPFAKLYGVDETTTLAALLEAKAAYEAKTKTLSAQTTIRLAGMSRAQLDQLEAEIAKVNALTADAEIEAAQLTRLQEVLTTMKTKPAGVETVVADFATLNPRAKHFGATEAEAKTVNGLKAAQARHTEQAATLQADFEEAFVTANLAKAELDALAAALVALRATDGEALTEAKIAGLDAATVTRYRTALAAMKVKPGNEGELDGWLKAKQQQQQQQQLTLQGLVRKFWKKPVRSITLDQAKNPETIHFIEGTHVRVEGIPGTHTVKKDADSVSLTRNTHHFNAYVAKLQRERRPGYVFRALNTQGKPTLYKVTATGITSATETELEQQQQRAAAFVQSQAARSVTHAASRDLTEAQARRKAALDKRKADAASLRTKHYTKPEVTDTARLAAEEAAKAAAERAEAEKNARKPKAAKTKILIITAEQAADLGSLSVEAFPADAKIKVKGQAGVFTLDRSGDVPALKPITATVDAEADREAQLLLEGTKAAALAKLATGNDADAVRLAEKARLAAELAADQAILDGARDGIAGYSAEQLTDLLSHFAGRENDATREAKAIAAARQQVIDREAEEALLRQQREEQAAALREAQQKTAAKEAFSASIKDLKSEAEIAAAREELAKLEDSDGELGRALDAQAVVIADAAQRLARETEEARQAEQRAKAAAEELRQKQLSESADQQLAHLRNTSGCPHGFTFKGYIDGVDGQVDLYVDRSEKSPKITRTAPTGPAYVAQKPPTPPAPIATPTTVYEVNFGSVGKRGRAKPDWRVIEIKGIIKKASGLPKTTDYKDCDFILLGDEVHQLQDGKGWVKIAARKKQ